MGDDATEAELAQGYSNGLKYALIGVTIHEVGHNWFPMIVNSDERQWTWMDEGLNTFLQYLAEQEWEEDYPSRRSEPKRIVDHWQPSEDVYDILRLSHIDIDFARALLPEFIVYWKDSNQTHTSWNSKFLQHAKYHWAKRHQIEQAGSSNAGQQGTHSTGRTRDRSLQDDLTDTSWAD